MLALRRQPEIRLNINYSITISLSEQPMRSTPKMESGHNERAWGWGGSSYIDRSPPDDMRMEVLYGGSSNGQSPSRERRGRSPCQRRGRSQSRHGRGRSPSGTRHERDFSLESRQDAGKMFFQVRIILT